MMVALLLGGLALAGPRGIESADAPVGLDRAYARRIALVVGIDRYPDDAKIDDLRFAEKDALDIAGVLSDPRWGDFDEIITQTGAVARDAFWTAFAEATDTLGPQDTFVLYFAGHGTLELTAAGTQLYLMPSDGQLDDPGGSGISLSALEDAVSALPARQRVVLVDACHSITADARAQLSEQTRQQLSRLRGAPPSPAPRDVSASEVFLYAAAYNQPAQEDEALQNGVYTHFLLRGLQGEADSNGDNLVEVMELHDWVSDQTERHTSGLQIPQLQARTVGREAIFLSGDALQRARAEELYRRRLARMRPTATGATRGLSTTTAAAASPDGWLLHGVQAGYTYQRLDAQHQAQAEALGEALTPHHATVGYRLRQQRPDGAVRPMLVEEVALTGLGGNDLLPQLTSLAGARLPGGVLAGVGARWSPDGLRPVGALGAEVSVGPALVPICLTADAGAEDFWGLSLTAGVSRTIR